MRKEPLLLRKEGLRQKLLLISLTTLGCPFLNKKNKMNDPTVINKEEKSNPEADPAIIAFI